MNTISKLTALTLSFALIFAGCEKDPLQPDKKALRISKIADNSDMENPWYEFHYDEKGLLTGITGDWADDNYTMLYNNKDLPIKIGEIDISWNENEFSFNEAGRNYFYELDSQGRIIKITDEYPDDNDVQITNLVWYENESVDMTQQNWNVSRTFNDKPSPVSSINIAILIICDIEFYPFEYYFQNQYCIATNQEDDYSVVDIEYLYNDDNYPTRLKGSKANYYVYFEYESD
jgi:hypothetical protein